MPARHRIRFIHDLFNLKRERGLSSQLVLYLPWFLRLGIAIGAQTLSKENVAWLKFQKVANEAYITNNILYVQEVVTHSN